MAEKPRGITKPKLKAGRIQLPVPVAGGNAEPSAEASVGPWIMPTDTLAAQC